MEWVDGRGLEVRCCVPRLRVYCVCRLHRQQDAGLAYYLGTQTRPRSAQARRSGTYMRISGTFAFRFGLSLFLSFSVSVS
jgi:hypothetical protein